MRLIFEYFDGLRNSNAMFSSRSDAEKFLNAVTSLHAIAPDCFEQAEGSGYQIVEAYQVQPGR